MVDSADVYLFNTLQIFTLVNVFGFQYAGVSSKSYLLPSFIFTVIASTRNHWKNFVETLHTNSSVCLDVSAWKWFWSANKYGRTAAIFKLLIVLYLTL